MKSVFKIMVVDDNRQLVEVLQEILQGNGYAVSTAFDGTSALALADREIFDLVILDYFLPDMNGLQLQQQLAQITDADYLIITAHGSIESAAEAVRRKGIVGYETKPLDFDRLLVLLRQIVDRRQAEWERDMSAARMNAVFQALPGHVIAIDKEYNLRDANVTPSVLANLGFKSKDDIIGRKCHEIFKHSPTICDGCHVVRCMNSGERETRFSTSQEEAYLGFSTKNYAAPIRDKNQQIIGAVECAMDITDLRSMEAQLRVAKEAAEAAARAKGEFLANMSHEIRTPINAVVGFSHILKDTPLNPAQQDYIKSILFSADILLSIINELLDFSKIEAGMIKTEAIDFEPEQLIKDVVELFAFKAAEKGIRLEYVLEGTVPPHLFGDMNRLRQALLNIVGNALKFTHQGHIRLSMATADETDADATLRFSVADTGIGISPAQIEILFKPFSQADASISRRYGGTGLGLAITKNFVELLGGEIGVESEPGRGSVFWFTAPLKKRLIAQPTPTAHIDKPSATLLKSQGARRILVAEDNVFNQKVIQIMLNGLGFVADVAANGGEALRMLSENTYQMIFMDIQMPEMDGVEATKQIRTAAAEFSDIPIIALTANPLLEDQKAWLGAGMSDCLIKPVKPDKLKEMIFRHLSQEQADHSENKIKSGYAETSGF